MKQSIVNLMGKNKMSVYQDNGYENRREYLECLAEDYDVTLDVVLNLAGLLGKSEDFDGLIVALEDYND